MDVGAAVDKNVINPVRYDQTKNELISLKGPSDRHTYDNSGKVHKISCTKAKVSIAAITPEITVYRKSLNEVA